MKDFEKFAATHKGLMFSLAEKNTKRNENGDAVIEKSDPWFEEDEWDDYYEELTAGGNFPAGSVVR